MVTEVKREHNYCLDFLKGIACICVVFMHCEFPGAFGILVQCVSRFCVPFFFMVAGYFYFYNDSAVQKVKTKRALNKLKHLGKIIFLAVALYVGFAVVGGGISPVTTDQIIDFLLFNQPFIIAGQMWFLFALLYDYVIYAFIDRWNFQNVCYKAIPVLILLYIALAQGAHLLGIAVPNMIYRNFLIEGMCFFLLGNWFHSAQERIRVNNKILLIVIVGTTLLCPVERFLMGRDFGVNILTFLQVSALFLYGIQNSGKFKDSILCRLGTELSMLVYVLHPAIWHTMEVLYMKLHIETSMLALYLMPLIVLGLTVGCATVCKFIEKSIKEKRISHG